MLSSPRSMPDTADTRSCACTRLHKTPQKTKEERKEKEKEDERKEENEERRGKENTIFGCLPSLYVLFLLSIIISSLSLFLSSFFLFVLEN
jgi:uncharacterized membrane protein